MNQNRVNGLQRMLPTEPVEIEKILDSKKANDNGYSKGRLPIIDCECGAEILVVPDLKAMNRAIKTHIGEHRRKERNAKNNVIVSDKISQLLSQLTLSKLSEQNKT